MIQRTTFRQDGNEIDTPFVDFDALHRIAGRNTILVEHEFSFGRIDTVSVGVCGIRIKLTKGALNLAL